MTGQIKSTWFISNSDGEKFYNDLKADLDIASFKGLYVEVQYSTAMQPDGRCVFSALLIGRVPASGNVS